MYHLDTRIRRLSRARYFHSRVIAELPDTCYPRPIAWTAAQINIRRRVSPIQPIESESMLEPLAHLPKFRAVESRSKRGHHFED